MSEPQEYKKLPGNTFDVGRFGKYSLWLANDHLLHIRNRGDSEEYKRFYYHDIQSILLRKTQQGTILNLIFGILAFVCIILLAFALARWKWQLLPVIAMTTLAAFFLAAFLNNALRGGTCVCHLQTAVHLQQLRSLSRVRSAMKALALLIEQVEQKQGFLTPEAILSRGTTQPDTTAQPFSLPETPNQYYGGNAHWVLFGLMVLQGLQTIIGIFYRSTAFYLWTSSMQFPIVIALILAIIRQRKSTLPNSIKKTVWVTLASYIVVGIVSYFYAFFYTLANANSSRLNPWDTVRAMIELSPLASLPLLIIVIVEGSMYILLGLIGLILVLRYRRQTLRKIQNEQG